MIYNGTVQTVKVKTARQTKKKKIWRAVMRQVYFLYCGVLRLSVTDRVYYIGIPSSVVNR
jgi:hypothetical protein